MKKFENLGRLLSKEEQKKIMGGNPPEGGDGSCTYNYCGISCSSQNGNCSWLYCDSSKSAIVGVCCDGQSHKCAGYSCPNACCDA